MFCILFFDCDICVLNNNLNLLFNTSYVSFYKGHDHLPEKTQQQFQL